MYMEKILKKNTKMETIIFISSRKALYEIRHPPYNVLKMDKTRMLPKINLHLREYIWLISVPDLWVISYFYYFIQKGNLL